MYFKKESRFESKQIYIYNGLMVCVIENFIESKHGIVHCDKVGRYALMPACLPACLLACLHMRLKDVQSAVQVCSLPHAHCR